MRILLILLLLSSSLFASAGEKEFFEANEYFNKGDYRKAIAVYEDLYSSGLGGVPLLYNTGCAYYRAGDLAKAMIWFQRAYRLDPDNPEVLHNIRLVTKFSVDKVTPVPKMFLLAAYDSVVLWYSPDTWGALVVLFFLLALGGFFLFRLAPVSSYRKIGFFALPVALILMVLTLTLTFSRIAVIDDASQAVIVAPKVSVQPSPGEGQKPLFDIHAALPVLIEGGAENGWYRIILPDGREGWVLQNSIEVI